MDVPALEELFCYRYSITGNGSQTFCYPQDCPDSRAMCVELCRRVAVMGAYTVLLLGAVTPSIHQFVRNTAMASKNAVADFFARRAARVRNSAITESLHARGLPHDVIRYEIFPLLEDA